MMLFTENCKTENNTVFSLPRVLQDILKFEGNSGTGHLLDPRNY